MTARNTIKETTHHKSSYTKKSTVNHFEKTAYDVDIEDLRSSGEGVVDGVVSVERQAGCAQRGPDGRLFVKGPLWGRARLHDGTRLERATHDVTGNGICTAKPANQDRKLRCA